jgi:hypothetical protein
MSRRLATTVHVHNPETLQPEVFEAGCVPPKWAQSAISNPDVWADDDPSADTDADDRTADAPPPQSGPGSGRGAWAAYAAGCGVDVPDGASREDIIAALAEAGKPV